MQTVTILEVATPISRDLQVALNYAAAPHWLFDGKLYIFYCALADAAILCGNAGIKDFMWGQPFAPFGKYTLASGKAEYAGLATDVVLPDDLPDHIPPVLNRQALPAMLEEDRTFLSRGRARRRAIEG